MMENQQQVAVFAVAVAVVVVAATTYMFVSRSSEETTTTATTPATATTTTTTTTTTATTPATTTSTTTTTAAATVFVPEEAPGRRIVSQPKISSLPAQETAMSYFDQLDVDKNNAISQNELGGVWKMLIKDLSYKPNVTKAYKMADYRGKDGVLVRSEFEAFVRYIIYYDHYYAAFSGENDKHVDYMDRDGFAKVATKLDVKDASQAFNLMDGNKSGKLSFAEFCSWMAQNTCEWKL